MLTGKPCESKVRALADGGVFQSLGVAAKEKTEVKLESPELSACRHSAKTLRTAGGTGADRKGGGSGQGLGGIGGRGSVRAQEEML